MGKFSRLGNDLYGGRKSIDFVGHRALWYAISVVIIGAALLVIALKGLTFGIEFTGGTQVRVELPASQVTQDTVDDLRQAIADSELDTAGAPNVTTSGSNAIVVEVGELSVAQTQELNQLIQKTTGASPDDISEDAIGASWGREVAQKAGTGVAVFLTLVVLFIWAYFREWKMSVAALVALFHDIVITIGVYSLSGFPVTPAAVTGLLAILGFSLYDTVVVFDKVRENTHELRDRRQSYAEAANLAVNQTLVRSINTSIVALIPIGAILYVAAVQLGGSTLQDLALAQFVGMAVGLFSSVFVAPRLMVHLKSTEKEVQEEDRRAKARAKRAADRYADVPAFSEDMPLRERTGFDPDADGLEEYELEDEGEDDAPRAPFRAPASGPQAAGSGRVIPETKAPVAPSGSAKRNQPSRQPRSKRGK